MINEGKFGVQEAVCLTTITISTKVFFTSPAFLTNFVGTAGWLMTFVSNLTAILAFSFIYLLLKRFPGKNIIEIYDISLGRIVGFVFSLTLAVSFFMFSSIITREFVDVMKVYVFPETPTSLLIAAFIAAVGAAVFYGLETLARVSKLIGYVLLASFILLLLLAAQNYKLTNIFPILGYGIDKIVLHGLRRSSAYDEVLILAVFAGSLQGIKTIKKAGFISLALSGFIIVSGLLCFSLAYPVQTTQELTAPIYVLSRDIKLGNFFQRLEPIFLFLWIFSTLITSSTLFYSSISCYCKIFRIQNPKPLILPLMVLYLTFAMLPKDFTSIIEGSVQITREYGWIIFYIFPLFALILAAIRNKRGDADNA